MLKPLFIAVALSSSVAVWAQAPVPPPPVDKMTRGEPETLAVEPTDSPVPGTTTSDGNAGFRYDCKDEVEDGVDDSGSWSILGNGYAELLNTTDPRAAFSLALLRTNGMCDQVQLGVSRGSTENALSEQSNFARFVLSPETSSWSAHVKFDQWLLPRKTLVLGWYAHGIIGSSIWQLAVDPSRPEDLTSRSVVAVSLSVGGSLGYLKKAGTNSLRILAHLGPTARLLVGDVWAEPSFLRSTLGSGQHGYLGVEGGFWIQLNTISVGMTFPLLLGSVPGLTNGQFLPSISVGGQLDLNSLMSSKKD